MIDLPGFADPVRDAQSCFRAVLDAMARPGRIHPAGIGLAVPAPLDAATAAVLLTLADADTPLWLAPEFSPAAAWIGFHCGAPIAPAPGAAGFVVATGWPDLAALNAGSDDAPEDSATVILQVQGFGHGTALLLAGPGLRAPATLRVAGLPAHFAAIWAANHALAPRGVDLILCAGGSVAALPRSVRITEG